MARRIEYTGAPVLTPEEVAAWRRNDAVLHEAELLRSVIIPGIVSQAETKTSAAIQEARYVDLWQAGRQSGDALDIGQVIEVESIDSIDSSGQPVPVLSSYYLVRDQRECYLHFVGERPAGVLLITYRAGMDLAAYPSVRTWLLMQIGTVLAQRETLIIGTIVAELPSSFIDTMLSVVEVPPRF